MDYRLRLLDGHEANTMLGWNQIVIDTWHWSNFLYLLSFAALQVSLFCLFIRQSP
jgi:hypothetical protein